MRKIPCLLAFAILVVGFASEGYARDWPDAGGWTIVEIDGGCIMTMEFEGAGGTELTLFLNTDRTQNLVAENMNWSVKKGQQYNLRYILDANEYSGGVTFGLDSNPKPSFGTKMAGDFAKDFAEAGGLKIYNGETLVDSLSLSGSGAGVAMLRRCTASMKVREDAENREKARLAHIPTDPFATTEKPQPADETPKPAVPRGDRSSWVSQDDYPPDSLRNKDRGKVTVDYAVNSQGRVEDCQIKVSSGSPILDATTCRLISRRGRYTISNIAIPRQSHSFTWNPPNM